METAEETQRRQDFMVALDVGDHAWLQDEAIRRTRSTGKKTHMTDVAREAIAEARKRAERRNGSS